MMRVLVTGGSGEVGKEVVRRLVSHGFQVKVIGRSSGVEIPGAAYQACDITDYPSLLDMVQGMEAVVHLAAIPNPSAASSEKVFLANVQGTFNIFKACEETGVRRVVQASSINALGVFYGLKEIAIEYLPVDEDHPTLATDAYSFSKHIIEEIGDYYWRRSGISSVALRLPYVTPPAYRASLPGRREHIKSICDRLSAQSIPERQRWFDQARENFNTTRALGVLEDPQNLEKFRSTNPDWPDDGWTAFSSRVNFFTVLDERDSAQAVEKSLLAQFEGSHALFVNDDHNWTGISSRTLADLFYPDIKKFKKDLVGAETLVSIERARQLIGFEVEYTFDAKD